MWYKFSFLIYDAPVLIQRLWPTILGSNSLITLGIPYKYERAMCCPDHIYADITLLEKVMYLSVSPCSAHDWYAAWSVSTLSNSTCARCPYRPISSHLTRADMRQSEAASCSCDWHFRSPCTYKTLLIILYAQICTHYNWILRPLM